MTGPSLSDELDLATLPEVIAGLLAADPVCGGRVSTGTIKALVDLVSRAAGASGIQRLLEREERLRAAISWIEPPFVDSETSPEELRMRVQFCVRDARLSGEGA